MIINDCLHAWLKVDLPRVCLSHTLIDNYPIDNLPSEYIHLLENI